MLQKISYNQLKVKISGTDQGRLSVKTSGILNYMFTTGMIEHVDKGMCSISQAALDAISTMTREPQSGDIIAVVNTGIYLLVDVTDEGKSVVCARIELNELKDNFVYNIPKFSVTTEPNDPLSTFNKFPINNVFVLRKGNFDMKEVKQLYDKFKQVWAIIHEVRKGPTVVEKGI